MGQSYSHLVLFGVEQQNVAAAVRKRQTVISPTVDNFTVVAAKVSRKQQLAQTLSLGLELSKALSCAVLLVNEFDDDVLSYDLIRSGVVIDKYESNPDYFDFYARRVPPRGPLGGHAARLCATLNRPDATQRVSSILRNADPSLSAPERHSQLLAALGMPAFCAGFDYDALERNELPDGLALADLVFSNAPPGQRL